MTKDELIAAKAQLESKVFSLEKKDEDARKELSVALDAPFKNGRYDDRQQITYSWEQIFVEIGKLLERKKQTDVERKVADLDFVIDGIRNELEQMRSPLTHDR